jgi:hypothetical protein
METIDAGEIVGQGEVVFHQTVHGPVIGYATVGGTRVAISQQRSSYMRDAQWNLLFKDATENRSRAQVVLQVRRAVAVHVQRRLRGRQAHRDLLGRAAAAAQPARGPAPADQGHGRVRVDRLPVGERARAPGRPEDGLLVNWNNKPAPNWGSADDNWAYGSVYRSQMLVGQPRQEEAATRSRA